MNTNTVGCSLDYAKYYVENLIKEAIVNFPKHFPNPIIIWKPMGIHYAGYAECSNNTILLNSNYLTSDSWESFLNRTPIHELAHLIAYKYYGDHGHGKNWKNVCFQLGIHPSRCHNYKKPNVTTGTKSRKRYSAHCNCMNWSLSSTRYNRMESGTIYYCRLCKSAITLD